MKKILIIEDNESIRQEIVTILNFEDYFVFEAGNGKKGLEIASIFKLDLIICDIMMPGIDGFTVLERIRENRKISFIPFIFLSALSAKEDLIKAAKRGVSNYLMKPFQPEELLEAIKRVFYRKILVVDDNYSIRQEIVTTLSFENYFVLEATNGKKGLEIAEREMPEIIISDISMPVMDGFTFLEKIRNNHLLAETPFILLSAFSSKSDLIRGAELGVTEYLIKPFSSLELIEIIERNILVPI